jgi:hypothetical protein
MFKTIGAALAAAFLVAACGGGGGDSGPPKLNGILSFKGSMLPTPATTAQAIDVAMVVNLVGNVAPDAPSVTFPFTVKRLTGTAVTYTGQATLTKITAGFSGIATLQMPAGQPIGVNTYCVQLLPADAYAFNGSVPSAAEGCTTVTVTP